MSLHERGSFQVSLDRKNYLLFKAVAKGFEAKGFNPGDAEDKAMTTLLEGYDRYLTLLAQLNQLTEAFKAERIGVSRIY